MSSQVAKGPSPATALPVAFPAHGHPDIFGRAVEKGKQDLSHGETKEEKAAIDAELKMLTNLYDEQEEKQIMENLAKKREARKSALEMKASEKAKKIEAKAEEKSAAKKQRAK